MSYSLFINCASVNSLSTGTHFHHQSVNSLFTLRTCLNHVSFNCASVNSLFTTTHVTIRVTTACLHFVHVCHVSFNCASVNSLFTRTHVTSRVTTACLHTSYIFCRQMIKTVSRLSLSHWQEIIQYGQLNKNWKELQNGSRRRSCAIGRPSSSRTAICLRT